MKQKKRDFGLILSLGLIIAIGSYWFVKEMPVTGIDYYIDYLGEKLMRMVPQERDKIELAAVYDEFRNRVKDKNIDPKDVKQVAAAIINLSNSTDTLTLKQAESLLNVALREFAVDSAIIFSPEGSEPDKEKWEELNERLSAVKELEEKLIESPVVALRGPGYRVDENLKIIIDTLDIMTIISWDSLEKEVAREIQAAEIEYKAGVRQNIKEKK